MRRGRNIPFTIASILMLGAALGAAGFLLVAAFEGPRAEAGTYTVCPSGCAYTSIQDAVDAASSGDTITIGPGIYHESVKVNRIGGIPPNPYSGGDAYLSGGGAFFPQTSVDANFKVVAVQTFPQAFLSNTSGTVDHYGIWGQSFTVPSGATDVKLGSFSFLKANGTPSGGGTGYVFSQEYTGTVSSLSSASTGLLASAVWDGLNGTYEFSGSGVTLVSGATYWFYSDTPLYVGVNSQSPTDFAVTLQGAGTEQTVIDGDNKDIVLRIGSRSDVTVKDLTILNGGISSYSDGDAFWQQQVLVNLKWETWYVAQFDIDVNFHLLTGTPVQPLISVEHGAEETYQFWGQSFKVPASAPAQKVTGFRFLGIDGTPAGAGTGYLFEGQGCLGNISCLTDPTSPIVASGSWNSSLGYYDLSGSNYTLKPGTHYWFYCDTAFSAGYVDPTSDYNCGGGINNQGDLTLIHTTVADSKSATYGGGVCMLAPSVFPFGTSSSLTVGSSIIANNTSVDGGGGIYAEDQTILKIGDSFITDNSGKHGGGIFAGGGLSGSTQTTITRTVIADNVAAWWGGGIFNGDSSLTIKESTLVGNEANNKGGAIVNAASQYGYAWLTLQKSNVEENKVTGASFSADGGGGIFNGETLYGRTTSASANIQESTIHHNRVLGTSGSGGGIKSLGMSLYLASSTVSSNEAPKGGGVAVATGSGIGNASAAIHDTTVIDNQSGGIHNQGDTSLNNTIVAKNGAKDCDGYVVASGLPSWAITSAGRNLDSDGSCKLTHSDDMSSVDPMLGPLAPNGGPTWTHAPQPGSPVIDWKPIPSANPCFSTDQRGVTRPQDGDGDGVAACDIGAVDVAVPQADPGGPYVIDEGSILQLDASGTTDPDNDISSLLFGWDWNDDGQFDDAAVISPTLPFTHTQDGPTILPLGLMVTDHLGFTDVKHTTVEVVNVAPSATFSRSLDFVFVYEAATLVFDNLSDPSPADTLAGFAYFVDCDFDGTFELAGALTTYNCVYSVSGWKPVTGRVEDKDGGFSDYLVEVPVITPEEGIGLLADDVAELAVDGFLVHKQEHALNQLLDGALSKLNMGMKTQAVDRLSDFASKVADYVADGTLTSAQGQPLIDLATRVIAAINSSP